MKTKKMIQYENKIIEVNIDQAYELFKGCIGKVARSFLGYSMTEISKIIGMSVSSVSYRVNNSLKKELLREEYYA